MSGAREWLERQSARTVLALGLVAVALIGVADYLTSYELSLAIFYLAPILAATWLAGPRVGHTLGVTSAATVLATDVLGGLPHSAFFFHVWDGVMRAAFFAVSVALLDALHQALRRERELARRDVLTGLANRNAFFETAEAEIDRARRYQRPLTVAYLDCDRFKEINDASGHQAGDRLLQALGAALVGVIRKTDTAARIGGDEFALLFPELGSAGAREVMAKVQARLREAMRAGGWPVTFSIGVVSYPQAGEGIDAVLRRADELMYEVKHAGRDGVRFAEIAQAPASPEQLRERRA